jgi:hypothetical protein
MLTYQSICRQSALSRSEAAPGEIAPESKIIGNSGAALIMSREPSLSPIILALSPSSSIGGKNASISSTSVTQWRRRLGVVAVRRSSQCNASSVMIGNGGALGDLAGSSRKSVGSDGKASR